MILMDEQGTKVTASCLQKFFPRFEKHLIQDDCLFIHRLSLAENKFIFKFAEKEQKVTFFYNTLITKCDSWSGSEHGFVFADFNSILDKSGSNDNSIPLGSILGLCSIINFRQRRECYKSNDKCCLQGNFQRLVISFYFFYL
ncbi:hypothetical protein Hdeb2414_s0006g00191741 [Helianthus debilis subsp. tardiflorus]